MCVCVRFSFTISHFLLCTTNVLWFGTRHSVVYSPEKRAFNVLQIVNLWCGWRATSNDDAAIIWINYANEIHKAIQFNCIAIDGMTQIMKGKLYKQIVCRSTLLRHKHSHSAHTSTSNNSTMPSQRNKSASVWKTNCNDSAFFRHFFNISHFLCIDLIFFPLKRQKSISNLIDDLVFIEDYNFCWVLFTVNLIFECDHLDKAPSRARINVTPPIEQFKNEVIRDDDGKLIKF